MLHVLLAFFCYVVIPLPETSGTRCDPSNYICSGPCPELPPDLELPKDVPVCLKNSETKGCVCWLQKSETFYLDSLFLCDVNGSVPNVVCQPPSHCFSPDSNPSCLLIPVCHCNLRPSYQLGSWTPIRGEVKIFLRTTPPQDDDDDDNIEKQPEVKEFNLKYLFYLLGFVIAPLLCWCLLNFLREGKCRKKSPAPAAESQPIPTSRSQTIDRVDREEFLPTCPSAPPQHSGSLRSGRGLNFSEVVVECTSPVPDYRMKCDSPPPYEESEDFVDLGGPPPSYDDAVFGTDTTISQSCQMILIVHPGQRENP